MAKKLPCNAGGDMGSIPDWRAKIHLPENQNLKQKQYCNKFNKDFKNGPHQKRNLKKKTKKKTSLNGYATFPVKARSWKTTRPMIQKKLFLFLLQGIIYLWLIDSGKSFL